MSLGEFESAHGEPGRQYELGRGVVAVIEIPDKRHLAQINALRRQLHAFDAAQPGLIHTIASGSECKIVIADNESERHPDLAVYKTPPPDEPDYWALWVPELVVEVVSPSSVERDYVEKRDDYLRFGVAEYWIIDAERGVFLVLRRSRGRWVERVVRAPERLTTRLLPGLDIDVAAVFAAAGR